MDFDALGQRLKDWDIALVIISDLSTKSSVRVGTSIGTESIGLENALFRDAETICLMACSLDGQLLPRIWRQGTISCVVCKPNEQTVVGLFSSEKFTPTEIYWWSKQLNAEVEEFFRRSAD